MANHHAYFITWGPDAGDLGGKRDRSIKEFHSLEALLKWIEEWKAHQQDGALPQQMVIFGAECLCDLR